MALNLKVSQLPHKSNELAFGQIHSLPFEVCEKDDIKDIKLDMYFLPIQSESKGVLTSSFHGRPLKGKSVKTAEGTCGVVVVEKGEELQCEEWFDEFCLWNLQDPPNADSRCVKAMQWMDIATCLRTPIEPIFKENGHRTKHNL